MNNYLDLARLSLFLNKLKSFFSPLIHSHFISQAEEPVGQNVGDLWFKEDDDEEA